MRFGFWEIILIIVLVMVLFGHSKFPSIMKNLAEGINVFKKEMKSNDDKKESSSAKVTEDKEVKEPGAEKPKAVAKPASVKKSPAKKPAAKKK